MELKKYPNYDPSAMEAFGNHEPGSYAAYYDKYSRVGAIKADELRNYYLANLNNLDDNIGRVLDALKEQNLAKKYAHCFLCPTMVDLR